MRPLPILICLGILTLPPRVPLLAQSSVGAVAYVSITEILEVAVDPTEIDFGTVAESGFATFPGVVTLGHWGNVTHSITISADADYWDAVLPANDDALFVELLEWSIFPNIWEPVTSSPFAIHENAPPGDFEDDESVELRLWIDATIPPDSYTLTLHFSTIAS